MPYGLPPARQVHRRVERPFAVLDRAAEPALLPGTDEEEGAALGRRLLLSREPADLADQAGHHAPLPCRMEVREVWLAAFFMAALWPMRTRWATSSGAHRVPGPSMGATQYAG